MTWIEGWGVFTLLVEFKIHTQQSFMIYVLCCLTTKGCFEKTALPSHRFKYWIPRSKKVLNLIMYCGCQHLNLVYSETVLRISYSTPTTTCSTIYKKVMANHLKCDKCTPKNGIGKDTACVQVNLLLWKTDSKWCTVVLFIFSGNSKNK